MNTDNENEGYRRRTSEIETVVHVSVTYPSGGGAQGATLHVTDGPSGFEFLTVSLTAEELLGMLASHGDVPRTAAVVRGAEHIGKEQEHDTTHFDHEPTEGELLDLQGDDWYVQTPHKNNRAQWVVTRRRWAHSQHGSAK